MVKLRTHILTDTDRTWFQEALEIYLNAHQNDIDSIHYSFSGTAYSALIVTKVEETDD